MIDMERIPAHVAIIMDGNGRWAKKRKLPRVMGHNAGMKAMKEIVKRASVLGVKHLTVYAFSTENWKRSEEEVGGIFKLLVKYVDSELEELSRENVKVNILGDWSVVPEDAKDRIETALSRTKDNTGLVFNIALNYGSRAEIKDAVKDIASKVKNGELDINKSYLNFPTSTGQTYTDDWDYLTIGAESATSWGTGLSLTYRYKSNFSWKIYADYDYSKKNFNMKYDPYHYLKKGQFHLQHDCRLF